MKTVIDHSRTINTLKYSFRELAAFRRSFKNKLNDDVDRGSLLKGTQYRETSSLDPDAL